MKLNLSTQAEAKSSKLAPKQMSVKFVEELRVSFFGVCLIEVSCKIDNLEFLDDESAHYFRFFNQLKEKKACFESSLFKEAEKTAFESQIAKKNLMAVLGFRTNHGAASFTDPW